MDFPTHPFYSPFHHQPPPTTSNTRLRAFLAPPTYVPTHMQHHSLMHVCYDHSNKNHCITLLTYSFTIINIIHFINSSIHYILIQFIIHIAFNISIQHSYLVQFHINSSFISFSPSMNSQIVHLHLMRFFAPQDLIIKHQIATYECQ